MKQRLIVNLLLAVDSHVQSIRCVRQYYWKIQLCVVAHVKKLVLVNLIAMFLQKKERKRLKKVLMGFSQNFIDYQLLSKRQHN